MDRPTTPHGTAVQLADGLPVEIRDRNGHVHAHLEWADRALVTASFPTCAAADGPPREETTVVLGATGEGAIEHPIFGRSHRVCHCRDNDHDLVHVATCGAVDWARPAHIPPLDRPGALPPGAGTAILNLIALCAQRAGVERLRYAGPYPTAALWASLGQCFRPLAGAGEDAFVAGGLDRAVRGDMSAVAVDFAPAPFDRIWHGPRVAVQLRERLDRVSIDGDAYAHGAGVRRLVAADGGWAAEVWFGDAPWARRGRFDVAGNPLEGPLPLPALDSPVLGQELPSEIRTALADLIAELVPAPLAEAARDELAEATVAWGDAGARAARDDGAVILVHCLLWDRLAPRGLGRVALALAEALAPVIAARAQRALADQAHAAYEA